MIRSTLNLIMHQGPPECQKSSDLEVKTLPSKLDVHDSILLKTFAVQLIFFALID